MKNSCIRCLSASVLVMWMAAAASADPVVVRFVEPDVTVGLGSVFTIDIVADIPDPVAGWGLDLTIDDGSIASTVGAPVIGASWFPEGCG